MRYYLLAAAISAVVSFALSVLAWRLGTKYRLAPKIRERDVHTTPTPRLGGVAMFAGVVVALLSAWLLFPLIAHVDYFRLVFQEPGHILAILGAAAIIVLIGVIDDLWDLDWMTKLAGQIIAAGLLAWQGVQLVSLPIGGLTIGSDDSLTEGNGRTFAINGPINNAGNFLVASVGNFTDLYLNGATLSGGGTLTLQNFARLRGTGAFTNNSIIQGDAEEILRDKRRDICSLIKDIRASQTPVH